jgi:serine/threonine-protein kinase
MTDHDPKLGLLLLGRYRIVRKLGEGGMGAVYEGLHELIGKRLAIKCLHAQYVSNREVVERFYREAQSATAVGNEHIIEVTDIGNFDDGAPFLVMEFLEGIEFARLIDQEGTLPIARMVHIVNQVCSALAAAHARGIVHRDMKPENIYLVKRGSDADFVKVLDFGISKVREQNEQLGSGLTRTGMTLGTPYYMAPEQAQAVRDIDHRADIYSVGVILYQGLTGTLPFDAESYPALMLKIMSEKPAPIRAFRKDVPETLEHVVLKAMARDRNQRFQSIEALAAALAPFAVLQTLPPVSMTPRTAPVPPQTTPFVSTHESGTPAVPAQPSRIKLYAGASAAAVALLGLGIWLATRSPEPVTPAPAPPVPAAVAQPVAPAPVSPQPQAVQAVPAPAPAQPSEVQVKISATPSESRIFIGEVEFPNPMDAYRPRSLDPIRIRVEALGHETVEQLAIFDQDRQLSFSLARGRGVRRLEAVGAPQPASPPKPAAAAAPPPPKPEPSAAPKPEPAAAPSTDGVYHGPTGKIRDDF